jgi:hypothetical protein
MGRLQPSNRIIVGIALLLFGGVLLGVGIHHVVSIGTCSSTGYSRYGGRVPYCPAGTGWWIAFLIGGIFLTVIGGLVAGSGAVGLILGITFGAIGVGALTVAFDSSVSSSKQTFGIVFGGFFLAAGAIALLASAWAAVSRRSRAAPRAPATAGGLSSSAFGSSVGEPDAIMGAYASGATDPRPPMPVSRPGAIAPTSTDPVDRLAKLADLHKSGALTDEEFAREKAKLLGEM